MRTRSRTRSASLIVAATLAAGTALLLATNSAGRAQSPPANDDFAGYKLVSLASTITSASGEYADTVSTAGATLEPGEPPCGAGDGATVWYVYYPEVSGEIFVDTAGSDFNTFVAVYRITNFAPSPPGGSLDELTCIGGGPAFQAKLDFSARSGEDGYAIQIGGWNGETGTLHVRIGCPLGCAPPNDALALAPLIFEAPFTDSTRSANATLEDGEPRPCGHIGKTVWYRIETSERAGDAIAIDATGDFQPVVALYKLDLRTSPSPPGSLDLVTCDAGAAGTGSGNITFTTEPFTTYYVQAGGAEGAGGALRVQMTCSTAICRFPTEHPPEPGGGVGGGTGGAGGESTGAANGGTGSIAGPDTGSGGYLPGAR